MFARGSIVAGEPLVVFGGEYTDAMGAKRAQTSGKLVMQWDDDLFSIEGRGDDQGYFINHSCDPNAWMEDACTIVAMRGIANGEEITADYALWEADENHVSPWSCQCGSTLCRKKITGRDWRMPELQKRYREHFSPLLNKRIKKFQKKL